MLFKKNWFYSFPLVFLVAGGICSAKEIWVAKTSPNFGKGSKSHPFRSINEALRKVQPGDSVNIHEGIYQEKVSLTVSGLANKPTVLRSVTGERVILSGFTPIRDWKPITKEIYTTVITAPIRDLYVEHTMQSVARWPDVSESLRKLSTPSSDSTSFKDSFSAAEKVTLKEIENSPDSAMVFLYLVKGNLYATKPIKKIDLSKETILMAPQTKYAVLDDKKDRYQIVNHVSLIRKPGQWAFKALNDNKYQVYFFPNKTSDLEKTQYQESPWVLKIGHSPKPVVHIRVEGLEIGGSLNHGLEAMNVDKLEVLGCTFHNNGGSGIWVRQSKNIEIKNNISLANQNGISIVSTKNALIEGNEISFNRVDGVDVAGNISGTPGREPETSDVLLKKNYIHHHYLLSHPDNVQTYRGVHNIKIEENLLLFAIQEVMTEETDGGAIANSTIIGSSAYSVIFGHKNSHNWNVTNVTIGLAELGLFQLTGKNYNLRNNIFWHTPLAMDEAANLVQEAASFRHAPAFQAVFNITETPYTDRLILERKSKEIKHFKIKDWIEINGDGIPRKITKMVNDEIHFSPALPQPPFRVVFVWNWKESSSLELDLRPLQKKNKTFGSDIDISAFKRGEFYRDGKRNIPNLPEDVKALTNPNTIVLPLYGS